MSPAAALPALAQSALLLALAACQPESAASLEFTFDAVDTNEQARPCMIVVDDDWTGAAERHQWVNVTGDDVLTITLPAPKTEWTVTVAPLLVESGQITRVPHSRKDARDYTGFADEVRLVRRTDPRRQLFILPRRTP